MCIDLNFTKNLLKNMIRNLEVAQEAYKRKDIPFNVLENEMVECYKGFELLQQHMKAVQTKEGTLDWDALVHSVT